MAVCLVTGGAGFIGSHLVEALFKQGHDVRVLDNFSIGSDSNLAGVSGEIEIIVGDVTNQTDVRSAMEDVDLVFHNAALLPSASQDIDPLLIHHAVATGTLHILQAAREAGVRRVIFASCATVYRSDENKPLQETDATLPRSLYSIAKLTAEDYCAAFHQTYGLDTVRLRYFNVFGPRLTDGHLHTETVAYLLQAIRSGTRPLLKGDGRQKRDFTHVNDIVQANLLAAEAPRVAGKLYNIATGQPTSLLDLVDLINQILGTNVQAIQDRGSEESHPFLWANINQAQTDLGYCPCTDLNRDLRDCLGMYEDASHPSTGQKRWDGQHSLSPHKLTRRSTEVPSNTLSKKEVVSR